MFDTTNPDLSAFQARGGKLILKGNGADYQRNVMQEIEYYHWVQAAMGPDRVNARLVAGRRVYLRSPPFVPETGDR